MLADDGVAVAWAVLAVPKAATALAVTLPNAVVVPHSLAFTLMAAVLFTHTDALAPVWTA